MYLVIVERPTPTAFPRAHRNGVIGRCSAVMRADICPSEPRNRQPVAIMECNFRYA